MPKDGAQAGRYTIRQNYRGKKGWSVVGDTGVVHGTHATRAAAINQQSAIYASQADSKKSISEEEKAVITNETTPNKYPQPVKAKKKKRFTDYEMVNKAEDLYGLLVPQEKAFHDSLVRIAEEYGPFDLASSGVWVGYESANENQNADIGVKCGNCSFHYEKTGGTLGCKLLSYEVEENAKCRLAAIPDGLVNAEMDNNMNDSMDDNMNDNMDMDNNMDDMGKADSVRVGQMVSWNSSGGRATGKVERVIRDGKYNVPNSDFVITGTPEAPAAVIRLYRDGKPTDTMVGHKLSTLRAMGKSIENIDLIKEAIASWDTEEIVEKSPAIESDSSEKTEVPEDLSSIFSNMPAHAKRVNTTGNAPISLNLFRNEERGRRNL
jgi:hypothetical protein